MTIQDATLDPPVAGEDTPAAEQAQVNSPARRQPPKVDESKLIAMYANFCRVTGTPEELIVDFGLNTQPFGGGDGPVAVDQRIVTNYFTAKRLLHALHMAVERHERAFGVLETDVQKRAKSSREQPGDN